jgi:hypothetical protein
MSQAEIILLTPILTLIVVALVGFVGCGSYLGPGGSEETEEKKPEEQQPPSQQPPSQQPPPASATPVEAYTKAIEATPGFVALWLLNEEKGNLAFPVGPLATTAKGVYTDAPGTAAGTGYALDAEGVLYSKDKADFAAEFAAGGYIEVPFAGPLNPDPKAPGFSIELWVKPDTTQGGDRHVLVSSHRINSPNDQRGYEIGLLEVPNQIHQQVYGRVYSSGGVQTMTEITVPLPDIAGDAADWRYVVFTYTWDGTKGWVNLRVQMLTSKAVYSAAQKEAWYDNVVEPDTETLRFAANHQSTPGLALAAGRLDNIAYYNAPLDDAAMTSHFSLI